MIETLTVIYEFVKFTLTTSQSYTQRLSDYTQRVDKDLKEVYT